MLRRLLKPKTSFKSLLRFATTKSKPSNEYSKTILLPRTEFPLRSSPSSQSTLFQDKTTIDLYKWQRQNLDNFNEFILHDGPPYANGNLHMGHALNKILKDIIVRYNVLTGKKVNYEPGWDCHGLPIELKTIENLSKKNKDIHDPIIIRKSAKETALKAIDLQKSEFSQFGILSNMYEDTSTYRTLDHKYEMRQLKLFKDMLDKGLVYRAYRPVYWSPSSKTALAEAELEYQDDHVSHSIYIGFPLSKPSENLNKILSGNETLKNIKLLCWTTTPWTLVGNMAVCIHPELDYAIVDRVDYNERYIVAISRIDAMEEKIGKLKILKTLKGTDIAGSEYTPPFHSQDATIPSFPVILANYVSNDTGTGLVHSAAAHGHDDYLAIKNELRSGSFDNDDNLHQSSKNSHKIPILNPVDSEGRFDSHEIRKICGQNDGSALDGLECLGDGNKEIIKLLESRSGWILAKDKIKHRYPYDWRTKKPVLIRSTSQWFANVDVLKNEAMKAIDDVKFIPTIGKQRLESFILGRSEWCISRQRVWGVPIPILYNETTGEPLVDNEIISHVINVLNERGVDAWWTDPAQDFLPKGKDLKVFKGMDTMDVWFDSGTSWTGLKKRENSNYPADIYLEGSDQHRGWFQSSLLASVAAGNKSPYSTLITHGMVVDELGRKMSKSLGNGLSPLDIVNGTKSSPAYGADVLRYWAASVEYTKDVPIGPTIIAQSSDSVKKVRNAARFIIGNINSGGKSINLNDKQFSTIDSWMLNQIYNLDKSCRQGYEDYIFSKVTQALLNFISGPLATYFEITKDSLYNDSKESISRKHIIYVLEKALETILKSTASITPYLAEEISQHYYDMTSSIFKNRWIPMSDDIYNDQIECSAKLLFSWKNEVLSQLERLRNEKIIKTSLEADVDINIGRKINEDVLDLINSNINDLSKLFVVSSVNVVYNDGSDLQFNVRKSKDEKCPRCWKFNRKPTEIVCTRCSDILN